MEILLNRSILSEEKRTNKEVKDEQGNNLLELSLRSSTPTPKFFAHPLNESILSGNIEDTAADGSLGKMNSVSRTEENVKLSTEDTTEDSKKIEKMESERGRRGKKTK